MQSACPFRADIVAKVFLGWRPKFFRTADAFCARGYEGPHRFAQKRSRSFVTALRCIAVAKSAKFRRLRDFLASFDFRLLQQNLPIADFRSARFRQVKSRSGKHCVVSINVAPASSVMLSPPGMAEGFVPAVVKQ
jgi:hypothetical protein